MLIEIGGDYFEADDIVGVQKTKIDGTVNLWMRGDPDAASVNWGGPNDGIKRLIDRINAAKTRHADR